MRTVISQDGTPIAFDQSGEGPPIILVVGAFNDRSTKMRESPFSLAKTSSYLQGVRPKCDNVHSRLSPM